MTNISTLQLFKSENDNKHSLGKIDAQIEDLTIRIETRDE